VKTHARWFLAIHLIYAYFITKYVSKVYDTRMMVFSMIPEKLKRKYSAFIPDFTKIKKWKLILGAIYLLPIRLTMLFVTLYTT